MSSCKSTIGWMCFLGAMSISAFANAQELTLVEAQHTAAQHSPMLGEMQADVRIAEASMDKAFAPRLPQVYANGRHLLDDKPQVMDINLGGGPTEFPLVIFLSA